MRFSKLGYLRVNKTSIMSLLRGIAQGTTLLLLGVIASCPEKDLYNSDEAAQKSKLSSEDSYFGFQLRGNIPLNVDCAASDKLKEWIIPIYKAFTGDRKSRLLCDANKLNIITIPANI